MYVDDNQRMGIEHCVYQSSLWLLYEIKPLFYSRFKVSSYAALLDFGLVVAVCLWLDSDKHFSS